MNQRHFDLLAPLVSPTYLAQCGASRNSLSRLFTELFSQRKIPDVGWTSDAIEVLIREISLWDSNNFADKAALGEREGRCFSDIVRRRHWSLTHGIGRSGDVNAEQPKAAGSSLILNLTRILVRDAIKNIFGINHVPKEIVVLPVATGMALMLGMSSVSQLHRDTKRRNVIWSRIDQKSCIKAMTYDPSLKVYVVEQRRDPNGEGLVTDVQSIVDLIQQLGNETIHSIVLTTSTFAPRTPDDIPAVSLICKDKNIPLIVNNAYGLQCTKCCHLINEAIRIGRLDLVVQSTDKNFGVPVGGSILFGPVANKVNEIYPGRASMSPILDLFITLLEVGKDRWIALLRQRKECLEFLVSELGKIQGVHVLSIPKNQISLALRLDPEMHLLDEQLGSDMFLRNICGSRVFVRSDCFKQFDNNIPGLMNFGCHSSEPAIERYLNLACAVGSSLEELSIFIARFKYLLEKRSRKIDA